MRVNRLTFLACAIGGMILASGARGQDTIRERPLPPAGSMKEIMLDVVHPASNDIQFAISRAPQSEKEWATVRHSALVLAEAGSTMTNLGTGVWIGYVNALTNAGNAAYKAAQAKDSAALAKVGPSLDASCTNCHKQFRPNVYPKEGASK